MDAREWKRSVAGGGGGGGGGRGGGGGEGGRIQSSLKLVRCIKLIIGLAGQKCLSQVTSTSRCALVNKQHT